MSVIDLFCGIGGLSYGFRSEGFDVLAGIDSDSSCRYAYEANIEAPFIGADIARVTGAQINRIFAERKGAYRVLIGCAPCTPFSIYTERHRSTERNDSRWRLLADFGRLIKTTKPDVVSMENVPRLALHDVFEEFLATLDSCGYEVRYQKLKAHDFGVPQRRSRLVLIASRLGVVEIPSPTHREPVTVRQAIGSLAPIEAGSAHKGDPIHVSRALSAINMERIRSTSEGGSWKDWESRLQLECHKKKNGKSFRSVYGRMQWDAPSPVITTQCLGIGNGRFGHPEQDRAISLREAAILQSFPKKFRFVAPGEPINTMRISRQIGNAVPVKLGKAIAKAIRQHLSDASR